MTSKRKNGNSVKEAYDAIQGLILSSKIKPEQIITEMGLSERLKIGRTPVREAIKILEQEGLIVRENRRKRVYLLTVKEAQEIFDIKIVLESAICAWAAERGIEKDFRHLEKIFNDMLNLISTRTDDEDSEKLWFEKWVKKDEELHQLIFKMAGNKRAENFILNLNKQWHRLRVGLMAMEGRIEKSVEEHKQFVEAILNRDPIGAKEAMREHLSNLRKVLVQILEMFHYPSM